MFGLGAGLITIALAIGARIVISLRQKKQSEQIPSIGYLALVIFMLGGILLSPFSLTFDIQSNNCGDDIINSYEEVGKYLSEIIPPGSLVFWKGGRSSIPLLYIPEVQIYPSQINGDYSYFLGGDSQIILKFGGWNEELANQWMQEADYLLIEERYMESWFKGIDLNDGYTQLEKSPYTNACRENSQIRIYERIK